MADLFDVLEARPVRSNALLPGVKRNKIIEVPDPGKIFSALFLHAITCDFISFNAAWIALRRSFARSLSQSRASSGKIPDLRPSLDTPESTRLITGKKGPKKGIFVSFKSCPICLCYFADIFFFFISQKIEVKLIFFNIFPDMHRIKSPVGMRRQSPSQEKSGKSIFLK